MSRLDELDVPLVPPDVPLDVRGGAGGISVRIDDLQEAAGALERVAAGVGEVTVRAGAVAGDPRLVLSGVLAPASLAVVEERFAAALLGPSGAMAAGVRMAVLAVRLRAAAAGYAVTETRVLLLVGKIEAGLRGRRASCRRRSPTWLRAPRPAADPRWPACSPPRPRLAGPGGERRGRRDLVGRPSPSPRRRAWPACSGSSQAPIPVRARRRGASWCSACCGQTVPAPGSSRSPGRGVGTPAGLGPLLDVTAGVTALAAGPTAASALVVRALDLAGARPGQPVLLAVTASGAVLAAQPAADPAVRARFSVTCVVTAGSPVARYAVPASVAVLSLEHADDVVPACSTARRTLDRAGWVTVRRPSGAREFPPDPAGAHDADAYAATGALVDASADPSPVAARRARPLRGRARRHRRPHRRHGAPGASGEGVGEGIGGGPGERVGDEVSSRCRRNAWSPAARPRAGGRRPSSR